MDGLYELSYLLRGSLNTMVMSHPAGARFVLLETVAAVAVPTAQIGIDVYHRATSFGKSTETGTVTHGVYEANSQTEWPVAHVLLNRVGDVINVEINPRHRFGTPVRPVRSANWIGYEIRFEDSLSAIATVQTADDIYSYDATAMTFPVTVSVSQINRITGPGPSVSEVIA